MAEAKKDVEGGGGAQPTASTLLTKAGETLVPLLVSGASLLGFVAFAGAMIVWTRLSVVKVPPDQAITAFPRSELIAIGAAVLLIFGFFGALITIAAYLTDRAGRATPGMARTLLLLLVLEGLAAVILVPGAGWESSLVAAVIFALAVGLVIWAISVDAFVEVRDVLHRRRSETEPPRLRAQALISLATSTRRSRILVLAVFGRLFVIVTVALIALLTVAGRWLDLTAIDGTALIAAMLAVGSVFAVAAGREIGFYAQARREREGEEPDPPASAAPQGFAALLAMRDKENWDEEEERVRLASSRPLRLFFTNPGLLFVAVVGVAAVLLPTFVLRERWLAGALAIAFVLCGGLWRIAVLSKTKFIWFALAVFLSVPLFGTLALMGRYLDNPQVQPIALLRAGDGSDQAIQGIYVTESSNRVYFANLASEGCSEKVAPSSGRLLWVPKSEVVAMSIGPSQDVDDAARSALEMAYALTPSVETPTGSRVDLELHGGPKPEVRGEEEKARLENPGPAVRPNFGRGLRLRPEHAPPDSKVTLMMRAPNVNDEGQEGFGEARAGSTLRLGGVEVDIVKERVETAGEAEFAGLAGGGEVKLEKRTLYTRSPGEGIIEIESEEEADDGLFVKIEDSAVKSLSGGQGPERIHLPVGETGELSGTAAVTLKGVEDPVYLRPRLVRQAWHPNHIRFIVPERGASGEVTVECKQLAGQPLLLVERPPVARVSVRMQAGSQRVVFDSGASSDEAGKLRSRRWTIAGRSVGGEEQVSVPLPPRLAAYSVSLAVTDSSGEADSVHLRLLRLPASRFGFGSVEPTNEEAAVEEVREAVREAIGAARPAAIELHGHADAVGSEAVNFRLSMERVERVRDELFAKGRVSSSDGPLANGRDPVPMTVRAFGETCPIVPSSGRQAANRRVEVFMLSPGASVATAKGCRAADIERSRW